MRAAIGPADPRVGSKAAPGDLDGKRDRKEQIESGWNANKARGDRRHEHQHRLQGSGLVACCEEARRACGDADPNDVG